MKIMNVKVLITGGAGYLGTVLSQHLLSEGYQVTVLDNLRNNQTSLLHLFRNENFKFIFGDVRDKGTLQSLVMENDVVIPLAAIVGMPACKVNPQLAIDTNYGQILNILEVLTKKQKIVLPNTNSQYGSSDSIITEESSFKPLSLYAETKCDAEKAVLNSGNGVVLRLATVFGVSSKMRLDLLVNNFVYKALDDGYLVLFESHFKRNYIHVQDIARTFQFIIENYGVCNNEPFNVGLSTANLSKMELATLIKKYVPNLVIVKEEFKKDFDQRNYIVSNEKLESKGWMPIYDLDYGVKQLIAIYPILNHINNKNFTNL